MIATTLPDPEPTPAKQPEDVFASLDALRIDPKMVDGPTVAKVLVTIPVRKPSKEMFVRTHPDSAAYSLDTFVLELKEENEIYLVAPNLRDQLLGEPTVHVKRLHLAVTRQCDVFVWPVRLPGADGRLDAWNESALEAQQLARHKWVRVSANRSLGAYDLAVAAVDQEPAWPKQPYNELLRIAFKGKIIDSVDHPVLRRLRGET
ncbi:MAG: hypothetical protein JO295_04085 [Verrucomicrobia bacterium]|nr:hypothetical protein [Verrucomicrobiota bacterium]